MTAPRRRGKRRTCEDCGKPCYGKRCPTCREKWMSEHTLSPCAETKLVRYVARRLTSSERAELALVPRLNTVLDAERLIEKWQRGEG